MNILFVDLENVCRSPMAEGMLKKKFKDNNLVGRIDSAGFESFYINEPPDERVVEVAKKNGYLLTGRARIFVKNDFHRFDKIYVMDTASYEKVMELANTTEQREKVDYAMNLLGKKRKNESIPNPFYTGTSDCENIFTLLDEVTDKIVEQMFQENIVTSK
jgi:protein-tyrosine phosphatase